MTSTRLPSAPRRRRPFGGRRRLRHGAARVATLGLVVPVLAVVACGPEEGGEADGGRTEVVADGRETAIESMLRESAGSWNAGDLDGFLDDYSTSPELTFTGSDGVMRGRDAVRERYLASYWAEGAERDSLRFEDLEVRPLGEDFALVLGRYVLHRPPADSVTASGPFTLVLRREDDGVWRIIHDHSS